MREASKDINETLCLRGVVLNEGVNVPDFTLSTGEILWMEMENPNWARLLLPFFNGLLYPKKGFFTLGGKDFHIDKNTYQILSCINIGYDHAGSSTLNSIVRWIAYNKKVNPAQLWGNCKKLLICMGCEYAASLEMKKMAVNTIKKINTAITLSIPRLVVVLNDPFFGLEEDSKKSISQEIETLSADGSSVIIMSQDSPACRIDKNIFLGSIQ